MAQPTNQTKLEILPSSETEFFIEIVDAQLTFVKDENGKVTHVTLRQGKRDPEKAKRVEPSETEAPGAEKPN
jgi:hypothetical protein